MDPYELTRMLYARVQALDPKNVSKIIGYLLLQDEAEQDMLRMALSSDALLFSLVAKAKQELGLSSSISFPLDHRGSFSRPEHPSLHFNTALDHQLQSTHHLRDGYHHPLLVNSHFPFQKHLPQQAEFANRYSSIQETYHQQQQQQPLFGAGVFPNDHFYPETFAFLNRNRLKQQKQQQQKSEEHDLSVNASDHGSPNSSSSSSNNSSSSSHAWKPCVYYSRGHCKHGSGCRFLHTPSNYDTTLQEPGSETAPERLEFEIQELLRGRKSPVPIPMLPQLYYEEFGRPLYSVMTSDPAPGSSLPSLLSHMKNTLVVDQPNGQQAVVLIDESSRFVVAGHRGDNYDHNGSSISPSSRQIYLTFPAESAFTEEDVNAHFSAYGPVQDVRIPYQQKRMFGFVTFIHAETVKTILAEGNPHYICGARVLVKPYRDKIKHGERKNNDQPRNMRNDDYLASKLLEGSIMQQQQRENYLHQKLVDFRLHPVAKPQIGATDITLQETNINLGYILGDDDTQTKPSHHIRSTYSRAPENPFAVIYEQETTKLVT